MKRRCLCAGLASVLLFFGGCSGQEKTEQSGNEDIPTNTSVAEQKKTETSSNTESMSKTNMNNTSQTGYTTTVPQLYKTAAEHGGRVERLDYDSLDYTHDSSKITKTAYVYTPYGYDEFFSVRFC